MTIIIKLCLQKHCSHNYIITYVHRFLAIYGCHNCCTAKKFKIMSNLTTKIFLYMAVCTYLANLVLLQFIHQTFLIPITYVVTISPSKFQTIHLDPVLHDIHMLCSLYRFGKLLR